MKILSGNHNKPRQSPNLHVLEMRFNHALTSGNNFRFRWPIFFKFELRLSRGFFYAPKNLRQVSTVFVFGAILTARDHIMAVSDEHNDTWTSLHSCANTDANSHSDAID